MSKRKIKLALLLYGTWSLLGIYADYAWLSQIPFYLIPLTSICSLYPPLLTVWYLHKLFDRRVPDWFTFWLVLGTASYGLMAQFYFPFLMTLVGPNFHDIGSMFWVAVYGSQAFVLFPYIKRISLPVVLPGLIYILSADLVHYFVPTFVDFNMTGYPLWMKYVTGLVALVLQIGCTIFICVSVKKRLAENVNVSTLPAGEIAASQL